MNARNSALLRSPLDPLRCASTNAQREPPPPLSQSGAVWTPSPNYSSGIHFPRNEETENVPSLMVWSHHPHDTVMDCGLVGTAPLLPSSPDLETNVSDSEDGPDFQCRYRPPPPCFSPDILQVPIVPRRLPIQKAVMVPAPPPPLALHSNMGTASAAAALRGTRGTTPLYACTGSTGNLACDDPPASLNELVPHEAPLCATCHTLAAPCLPLMATPELVARSTVNLQVALEMRRHEAERLLLECPFH
jgi:hypothetical protein